MVAPNPVAEERHRLPRQPAAAGLLGVHRQLQCSRRSLPDRWQPSPYFRAGRLPHHLVSRPARRSLALQPAWSLNRPRRPLSSECFSRCRCLHRPLRLLPAGLRPGVPDAVDDGLIRRQRGASPVRRDVTESAGSTRTLSASQSKNHQTRLSTSSFRLRRRGGGPRPRVRPAVCVSQASPVLT